MQVDDRDAIQYLRLNELRDHINDFLFPYLTTITPYFRLVSWLTWIYARLEYERLRSTRMTLHDYVNRALRYYGIFAVAHVLFAQSSEDEHWGPIGVLALEAKLKDLEGTHVDFSHPTFGRPLNPTGIYKSSLVAMRLFEEKQQPISPTRFQSILIPTKKGKELAEEFESNWSKSVKPRRLTEKLVWKKDDLIKLGRSINLQGLSSGDTESKLLMDSVRSSMKDPKLYDDFVDLAVRTAKKCKEIEVYIDPADIGKIALYRCLKIETSKQLIKVRLKNSQATALLAYHELHTHMSYGADAILDGLVNLARENRVGISTSQIVKKTARIFENEPQLSREKYLEGLFSRIEDSFFEAQGSYQQGYPPIWSQCGFERTQNKIDDSENDYQQIAFGSMILLQSAACQNLFNSKWLVKTLPYHRKVFSPYTLLEEYQSLPSKALVQDWIESTMELIVQKHNDVALSKGPYAKRFDLIGNKLFYRADADFNIQRGRLSNAVTWLSDVALLKRYGSLFTVGG